MRLLINQLPSSSAYITALLDDPDYAEWLASQPQAPPSPPPLSEWTPEVARLADIYDAVRSLEGAVIRASGNKAPRYEPMPRPVTGVQEARERVAQRRYEALVGEVKEAQQRWAASRGSDASSGR